MRYWAPLLHIYQPPTQTLDVLRRINEECYEPLFKMLLRNPNVKMTLNINGVLIDLLLENKLNDTIDLLIELVQKNIVEIVGTAKYHPLLPLIKPKESRRQIKLNEDLNFSIFGKEWKKKGFFPPEMAISQTVLNIVKEMGYNWLICSGIACPASWPTDKIYQNDDGLKILFRDDIISNEISFKKIKVSKFLEKIKNCNTHTSDSYVITAMDGETFGHHIPNYEKDFLEVVIRSVEKDSNINICLISDLLEKFPIEKTPIQPKDSSWSTTIEDINENIPYPLWKHPKNPTHKQQFRMLKYLDKLMEICVPLYEKAGEDKGNFRVHYETARYYYDRGIYSCPMWWASMRPQWDPNLIYKGANLQLLSALNAQLSLIALHISEGDEHYEHFINFHHKLLNELTRETANLNGLRTF